MTITGKKYVECTVLESGNSVGAEAEDSSYDSDCEAEDPRSLFDSQLITAKHADVSRTASDTLATEFAEYVTVHGASAASYTPGYAARVEFGLKLGYTERLVQTALQKLGPDPDQNELLAELIKLGASNVAPKLADTPDETEALLPDSEIHLASCHFIQERINSSDNPSYLRPVVVDGSNVAMSHGNKEVFSCRGIKICVDWFRTRGHREITVFVPKWRKEASRPDNPIADQDILGELERDRLLVFTPSRLVGGKRMVCYDDRYILRLAAELDGIVVSNDNYRDLAQESPEFRKVVEERILMYSFVNDRFMPPDDPLGRTGPTLDNFLRVGTRQTESTRPCPYAKKCTYGNKCKFRHPERGPHPQKSVSERLVEQAQRHQARNPLSMQLLKSISTPITQQQQPPQHSLLTKTKSWAPSDTSLTTSTSKSRSVENVTVDSSVAHVQSCNKIASNQAYPSTFGWVAPKVVNMEMEPANMHRKLQRQLTLNPSCDARINQLRRFHDHQQQQQQTLTSQQPQLQSNCSSQDTRNKLHYALHTRQVTRQNSSDASYATSLSWDHQQQQHRKHQHVTRIASAPDSYQAWASRANNSKTDSSASAQQTKPVQRLGTSDSQLNVFEPQPVNLPMSNWGAQQQHQDARRHLHYHLANIFPEKQVQAAMALHPYETDPQQICAAILRMFPKL